MLEFFRRHRGAFLITITVVIIISFSVWGGWKSGRDTMAGQPTDIAFTIYGRDYTIAEAQRYGRRMNVVYMLQLFDLMSGLSRASQSAEDRGSDIILNQIVLQKEMERLGIHPSDAEAKAAMEQLPAFMENGAFSQQRAYNAEQMLGAYGFNGSDMLDVMKLHLGFTKLRDLLGRNYQAGPLEAEKAYASEYQTLKVRTASFALDDFKKTAQVSDADIQKYYDEKKDAYLSEEKRAVSYVFFEDPKDLDKKPLEERQKLQKAVVERVNQFNDASIQPGAKFDEVAAKLKETVVKAGPFARSAAPEALKAEEELLNAVFALNREARGISDPVKGAKGYYIFTVTQVEAPKQQELAAVKDKVKEALVAQKAQEALTKAVNDARTALADGLKAGKNIDELAKTAKLTLSPVTDVTVAEPPQELASGYQIARQAQDTPAGEVARALDTETGALIVYVQAKELRKRDDSKTLRENMSGTRSEMERDRLFNAWFNRRREAAKAKVLVTQA